jgi:hypothetical protein
MKPHKWAKEIKAWADGEQIEWLNGDEWIDCSRIEMPKWKEDWEYRIKPQPKEPQYLYVYLRDGKFEIGYAPHAGLNMWHTEIIGKIKLEQDDE